jgi:hypothetical protein
MKATITTLHKMGEDQIKEDISMTPLERLELAFQISDFAIELQHTRKPAYEEFTSIRWMELSKVFLTDDEGNAR